MIMKHVSEKIEEAIKQYHPQDVLVAWDIDLTLIMPEKPEAQFPNVEKHYDLFKKLTQDTTQLHIELMYNLIGARCHKNHEKIITEEEVVDFIKTLQKKNIKNMALTAAMSGSFGPIAHIESWRYETLKNFDIDFSQSFQDQEMLLKKLPAYFNRYPTFFKGILYSNGEHSLTDKGSVLTHFLQEINYLPKLIVLIDDREKNLIDVEKAIQKTLPKVDFLSVHYRKGREIASREVTQEEFKNYWHPIVEEAKKLVSQYLKI